MAELEPLLRLQVPQALDVKAYLVKDKDGNQLVRTEAELLALGLLPEKLAALPVQGV